ncbi:MAG: metal-dependent hydrolase, partial [Planctomycetota bacterium]
MKITWLGHNCWSIETAQHKLLIDPFLDDSPVAPIKAADIEADFVIVSHGHFDHISDAAAIATRTGATVVANFEVGNWLKGQGVAEDKLEQGNPGGGIDLPFGRLTFTIAHHSSSLPDGSYGGVACGLLLAIEGKTLYFACDTALFLDMKLLGAGAAATGGLDLAVLP